MSFFIIFILCLVLIFVLWPNIQQWVARKIMQRIARNMGLDPEAYEQQRKKHNRQQSNSSNAKQSNGVQDKVGLDELAKRKFDKENSSEYADFEDIP
ncbi:hypothetical protein HR11_04485 [Porphyromonas macacae]|uniref:DUF4834 family protein n=1 Tax=Porphyromonas macacae TaxID=28115 RepID=A0A0A2G8E3_9PORP|nr:DUF4834 family protein [Porphyromonas macacae]KGN73288.1 hypothetical protein HQ47_07330 [Porphyromonas macacae]KGN99511.1 hypothetical protein HR11_04485 [Porphyromonas macacae]SUB87958.1 Uncharacterised protein [Porphyromonas macacae]